jgi:hypothetical protein
MLLSEMCCCAWGQPTTLYANLSPLCQVYITLLSTELQVHIPILKGRFYHCFSRHGQSAIQPTVWECVQHLWHP